MSTAPRPERTSSRKAFRVVLGILIALVVVALILIVASVALWIGGFSVGQ